MESGRRKRTVSAFWILHISGWLVYSGSAAIISYRRQWTDVRQLLLILVPFVGGFLIGIPLRYFYKKIRLHERPLKYLILIALGASLIGTTFWLGIDAVFSLLIPHPAGPPMTFIQIYVHYVVNGGVPLFGWTTLYFSIKARREWKQQELRTEEANSLAQSAQLTMLRYQLNPHFLFNTMNSIRALVDEDETKAREMITELSEFLRYSLDSKNYAEVPLRHEIEAITHYFAIQKKRYEDKLEVHYNIEPQAGEFPVLSFLIHPLVENAVKYGMRTSPMPLVVHLNAKIRDGALMIDVINTGRWVKPGDQVGQLTGGTGTGLDNVRRRLENAFPGRYRFEVVEKEGRVHIQLEIQGAERAGDEKAS